MTDCSSARPAPWRCPTLEEIMESALALLPRGRAWQSNEGGPRTGVDGPFNPDAFSDAFSTDQQPASVLYQFWRAIAAMFWFVNHRLCDLRQEFWCATESETHDLWMAEYGLPDACDPFPDLCTKVAAIGGTRCDYYQAIAARAGWSLECLDELCGAVTGCALAGRATAGGVRKSALLRVIVDLDKSPAYAGPARTVVPMSGRYLSGQPAACNSGPIDVTPLECLLARVVHAEILIVYEVI